MKRHLFDPDWPAPATYLVELGRMTALWGSLEAAMIAGLSKLAGYQTLLDYRALILVAHANFQQRMDMVSALCEQLAPQFPHLSDYKAVIKLMQAAQRARNKYAHNGITWNDETNRVEISYVSARGTLKTSVESVDLKDIKEATAKIHEAVCALHGLVTGHIIPPIWERDA